MRTLEKSALLASFFLNRHTTRKAWVMSLIDVELGNNTGSTKCMTLVMETQGIIFEIKSPSLRFHTLEIVM